ncbi:Tn3 family transposase (plasmid) [Rhizobium sp. NIBRBAC000502774]|nr:Tn3 family transposase [Rhizobium sp. NIBRBAC000502774]
MNSIRLSESQPCPPYHRFPSLGEIRDRSFESQAFRASGLNLVVSAIVHWNTVYLGRAITQLKRAGRDIPKAHLAAQLGTYQPYRHLHLGC